MADEFDPNKPFETKAPGETTPEFDPNKPFQTAAPATSLPAPKTWSEVPGQALQSLPHSALEFGKSVVAPLGDVAELGARGIEAATQYVHPHAPRAPQPFETTEAFTNLGLGLLEKAGIKAPAGHEQYADAVGRYFADRYGGIENLRTTMAHDPVGFAADLATVLTAGGGALARAPSVAGKVGEVVSAAGRAVDPLAVAGYAAKPALHVGAELLGTTTGAGGEAIKEAGRAGYAGGKTAEAFRENIRGIAPREEVVADAQRAIDNLYKKRGNAYVEAKEALFKKDAPFGPEQRVLDFNRIDKAIADSGAIQTFRGQDLSPTTAKIRDDMIGAINDWKALPPADFHTIEGIDALKQKLGNYLDSAQPRTPESAVAGKLYNAVRQTIVDWDPEYAKIMKGYEDASKELKTLEREFSVPNWRRGSANINTALRKLQGSLRNNVSTAYGNRRELAQYLADNGSPQLIQKLAGQALNPLAPRGIARVGPAILPELGAFLLGSGAAAPGTIAATAGALAASSPRLVGEAAYVGGRGARAARIAGKPFYQAGRLQRATTPPQRQAGGTVPAANNKHLNTILTNHEARTSLGARVALGNMMGATGAQSLAYMIGSIVHSSDAVAKIRVLISRIKNAKLQRAVPIALEGLRRAVIDELGSPAAANELLQKSGLHEADAQNQNRQTRSPALRQHGGTVPAAGGERGEPEHKTPTAAVRAGLPAARGNAQKKQDGGEVDQIKPGTHQQLAISLQGSPVGRTRSIFSSMPPSKIKPPQALSRYDIQRQLRDVGMPPGSFQEGGDTDVEDQRARGGLVP